MTKSELQEYIIRSLGGIDFINVELSDEQLNDVIQDAYDRFTERHYEATINAIYKLEMNDGQSTYDIPERIKSIIGIFPESSGLCNDFADLMIPLQPPFTNFLFQVPNRLNVVDMTVFRMQLQEYQNTFAKDALRFDFNSTMNSLYVAGEADTFFLFVNELPEDKLEKIYNNRWFKKYCIALAMVQWGLNLIKFRNAPLPGGAELNGDAILAEGKEMITQLEEQIEDEFTEPPDMVIG